MTLKQVISGGQTGVDMAGLLAAKLCGIRTGGTAPHGWRTENGSNPTLRDFGLKEHRSRNYPPRTWQNITDADLTLVIANKLTGGSGLTVKLALKMHKPVFHMGTYDFQIEQSFKEIVHWIRLRKHDVINIAGHRESSLPGIEKTAASFLMKLFMVLK